jgi:hypothetical protein
MLFDPGWGQISPPRSNIIPTISTRRRGAAGETAQVDAMRPGGKNSNEQQDDADLNWQ